MLSFNHPSVVLTADVFPFFYSEVLKKKKLLQQKLYYFQYVNILVVGNTPYGKRAISRAEPMYGKSNILD